MNINKINENKHVIVKPIHSRFTQNLKLNTIKKILNYLNTIIYF